ncbi:MAG: prepilin-type N-terminal cleavage/methylation domain-containing protein [Planctomycetes bacterium]|nr:prepilin-type N-terminal cleavage/methylation domain-containing protein [Planctomycetota bacterium]
MIRQRAFTILELLVVILVISALMGMLFPAVHWYRDQAIKKTTAAMMAAISAAIISYRRESIVVPALGNPALVDDQTRRLWDFNIGSCTSPTFDYILDGDPELDPGFSASDRAAAKNIGYRGFLATSGASLSKAVVAPDGRLMDPWKRPIHIRYATGAYGAANFGVWSNGPDGVEGTEDDIRSWIQNDEK